MSESFAWMAWTWPTAAFFAAIALMLTGMTVWQFAHPSVERVGVLGIPTTRGDRLFITLLGTAFICLTWLGLVGPELWWALGISFLFGVAVFRFV
jgi:predicted small integral membrane protein